MEVENKSADWRSILLLVFSVSSALLMLMAALITLIVQNVASPLDPVMATSPLADALGIGLMLTAALLVLPAGWFSLGRLRGKERKEFHFPKLRPWMWALLITVWMLSLGLATLLYDAPGAQWYVPFLHFLSIALPIYILVNIAAGRLPVGSRQRAWGVFGSGMLLGPMLAIVAEITLVLIGAVIAGIFLGFNPENLSAFQRTMEQIQHAANLESVMYILGPILKNPLALVIGLAFLSVFVPFLEEVFKSVSVWLVFDKLTSPAQGFALGAISGAAFALLESLGASMSPDSSWGAALFMRAISSMMHILAAGVAGWGIARARTEKNYKVMIGAYLLAMSIHGLWNAGAVLSATGGVRVALLPGSFDIFGILMMLIGLSILLLMMGTMLGTLIFFNQKLAKTIPLAAEVNVESVPEFNLPGEG